MEGRGWCEGGAGAAAPTEATTPSGRDDEPCHRRAFAETRSSSGGVVMIDCRRLDEAIEIARHASSRPVIGPIEIRPLLETR